MQTQFSLTQLADPDIAEADKILRSCVHCGFCTATCPTYVLLGDERDSPRGRIYFVKTMLETGAPASAETVQHLDRCLTCLACMTTCPASVDFMHLIEHGRHHAQKTHQRPVPDRLMRRLLLAVLPYTKRFSLALQMGKLTRPFKGWLPARLRNLVDATNSAPQPSRTASTGTFAATGTRRMRVALLSGCVQPALSPEINASAIRLLGRLGAEVIVSPRAGCCGALAHHLSDERAAIRAAKANIDAWTDEIDSGGLDAIVVTASGCGTEIKDYAHLLRHEPAHAEKAKRIASLARDITEVVSELRLGDALPREAPPIIYHSPCSLQHGQGLDRLPQDLLRRAGFEVRTPREAHLCCGSAGTYSLLEPEIAGELGRRKAHNIETAGGEIIATGNIGCMMQIARYAPLPIVHTIELLDWATGGPKPF
jgi:glycolate oxidase iron-sulfur subunit